MTGKRRANLSESENNSSDDDFIVGDDSSNSRSKGGGEGSNGSSGSQGPTRKRGRGPSKRPCLNRNALMARVNRQRKKEYLEKVENKLAYYRRENKNLSNVIQQQSIDLKRLTAEVAYLRNVLNNSSAITALLKTMNDSLRQSKVRKEEDKWDSERLEENKECARKLPKSESSDREGKDGNRNIETLLSFVESDHNYSNAIIANSLFDFEGITCDSPGKGTFNLASGNQANVKYTDELSPVGISDVDIDQLAEFDAAIFDLPNSDVSDGLDIFRSNQSQPDNLIENLGNSGICLHVNSGRISLEFCSICHLNSINSDDP
uniref:BZIP domain-containing protein n=1 Tax=Bracon brevicornis TaxID=1563983 RepID=A0A6V7M1B3_9HYME